MEQFNRIRQMEAIMDHAETVLDQLRQALDNYQQLTDELAQLEDYYGSDLWRKDFDDDTAGKFPEDLKRGVLSEDGIWNLLSDRSELLDHMGKLTGSKKDTEN